MSAVLPILDGPTAAAGLAGAGLGLGALLIAAGLTAQPDRLRPQPRWRDRLTALRNPAWWRAHRDRLVLASVSATAAAVLTRWPAAAFLAAAGAWWAPTVLGADKATALAVARAEALATWAELLRDTLRAGAGLQQTILATLPAVPAAIRTPISAAAARLHAGQRLPDALRAAADELRDPTADLMLAALIQAAEHQAGQLGQLLSDLAEATREQAALQLRMAAERARTRTTARVVIGTTLTTAAGMILLNRAFLAPYDSATGQLLLLLVGAFFAAGFAWVARLSRMREPRRHLALAQTSPTATPNASTATGRRTDSRDPAGSRVAGVRISERWMAGGEER